MDRFRRSLSYRKKRDITLESSIPYQWQEDEKKIQNGSCSFQVQYLGCIEVCESRGIKICKEAIRSLKSSKGKHHHAVLYISGDTLRIADEITKNLIVDQAIEKVSFCAPDRSNEKGFAYICHDGTTQKWMCHGFLALKESGERLSHAVGCAFTVCLQKKQTKEEKVTVAFNENGTSFSRTGSFRQTSMTERIMDPQSAIIAVPIPVKKSENLYEIQRPRASVDMLQRQSSFRGFSKLTETSPFKRQLSLQVKQSSTTNNLRQFVVENGAEKDSHQTSHVPYAAITEALPPNESSNSIARICQEMSRGLSTMSSDDPFLVDPAIDCLGLDGSGQHLSEIASTAGEPIRQKNPWIPHQMHSSRVSDADLWLNSTVNTVGGTGHDVTPLHPHITSNSVPSSASFTPQSHLPSAVVDCQPAVVQRAAHLSHIRAHSVDSAYTSQLITGHSSSHQICNNIINFNSQMGHDCHGVRNSLSSDTKIMDSTPGYDPFDAAWAAKIARQSTNPYQSLSSSNKCFEVKL